MVDKHESNALKQRRLHDVEVMLGEKDIRLSTLTTKLAEALQENQRLKKQLETRDRDLDYSRRLAEGSKRSQFELQQQLDAAKDHLKRLEAKLLTEYTAPAHLFEC